MTRRAAAAPRAGSGTVMGPDRTENAPQTATAGQRGRFGSNKPPTAVAAPESSESHATRVLGLDLAASTTGYCLLVGGRPEAHGSFTLPDRRRRESLSSWLSRRSEELGRQVMLLVSTHRPELVGWEYPDTYRRSWSGGTKAREFVVAQALGRTQGMLVTLWPQIGAGVRLVEVSTSDAKRLAAGRVDASKDQVNYGLRTYRGWDLRGWTEDAVDAAAVALAAREQM